MLASLHGGQAAANEKGRALASEPLHASQLYETPATFGISKAKGPATPTAAVPLAEAAEAAAKAQPTVLHQSSLAHAALVLVLVAKE